KRSTTHHFVLILFCMVMSGQWQQWDGTDSEGYVLKVGLTFFGEALRQHDGKWKATLNCGALGWFATRDQAMDRVEEEITMQMRLAIVDLTSFRPRRPEQWRETKRMGSTRTEADTQVGNG